MRVLSLIHDPAWTESRIHDVLRARGLEVELRCHPAGDPLPRPRSDEFDAIVVNGGPVSTHQVDDHPFMAREIAFTTEWLATGRPFLGICLGAHVLGAAVGVSTGPRPDGAAEYGFCPIEPTEAGAALFGDLEQVFQCHYEGLDRLPDGAELLATGDRFEVQAFRLGPAIGLQFHPDARADMIEGWWQGNAEVRRRPGVQPLDRQRAEARRLEPERAAFVERLVDRWLPEARTDGRAA